ncbi:YopX family protein [Campylobacter vulpis]|uniref:YopX family protein n=1 Tax=Campylobacter vulpis TaxID=1655500 RepID=UPI001BCDD77A|nr:YopX family protein [Campylobacter vulpis]MBS4407504.1 hypothetical protein [Campylobacter vulpis]
MKLKDFDFRILKHKNERENYASCNNDECVCNSAFLYGDEAKFRLGEFILSGEKTGQETQVELYTGIKDSCGNKIYEKDILKVSNKIKDEEDEEFVAIAKKYTDDSIPLYFMLYEPNRKNWYDFEYYETEIIGNIHEVEIGKVYF